MRRAIFFGLFLMTMVLLLLISTQPVAQASGDATPVPPGGTPTPGATPLPDGTAPRSGRLSPAVLLNSDFEGGLLGWTTWQEDTGKPARAESLNYALPPVFGVERNPALVESGTVALHIGRMYDPWHAGLKQVTQVTPGARVRFCADGRVYASNRDFGHEPSWAALDGKLKVGVASGDAAWDAESVVWSDPANPHDEWLALCVEGAADDAGRVTVFTSADFRGVAAKHLDVWWDASRLFADTPDQGGAPTMASGSTPVSVWLLLPTGPALNLTNEQPAYRAVPAQLYAGAVITLALGQPLITLTSTSFMTGAVSLTPLTITTNTVTGNPPQLTPTAGATVAARSGATPLPTQTPRSIPTVIGTPVDPALPVTDVRPEPTLAPTSTTSIAHTPLPADSLQATLSVDSLITLEPNNDLSRRSTALPAAEGLLGFGVLLVLGVGGGLWLLTRRR